MRSLGCGLFLRVCLAWIVLLCFVVACSAPPPVLKQPSPLLLPVGAPIWLAGQAPASLSDSSTAQKLRTYQKAVPADFGLKGFVPNPDPNQPFALAKPNLINNTADGNGFWVFRFWVPTGKTTTINVDIVGTEPCQSSFFPTSFNIVLEPNPDIPAIEYEYGVGPSSNTKDGAYALSLSDETGQSFGYTVYVNNGIPAVCPTPAPTPTPTAVPCKGNPKNCVTPTPSPMPSPTPSPTPTPTPSPTLSASPSANPSASPSTSPSPSATSTSLPEEESCEDENTEGFRILGENTGGSRLNFQNILTSSSSNIPVNGRLINGVVNGRQFLEQLPRYSSVELRAIEGELQVHLRAVRSGTKPRAGKNYTISDVQFAEALLQAVIKQIPETKQLCNADSFGQLLSYYGNMNLGNIVQTNHESDIHDRELASRLQQLEGGASVKSNITFEGFGDGNPKEIDAISDHWLGEAMAAVPSTGEFAKKKREQTIRDMVIAKRTGRQVYFYFAHSANSEASAKIVEQLTRYAERIGVTGIVEIAGNKQPLNYV